LSVSNIKVVEKTLTPCVSTKEVDEEEVDDGNASAAYLLYLFQLAVRRAICPSFLSHAISQQLEERHVVVFLLALKRLWMGSSGYKMKGPKLWRTRKGVEEAKVVEWIMALLDSSAVRLMLSSSNSGSGRRVYELLSSLQQLAGEEMKRWEAWETLGGYLDQLGKDDYQIVTTSAYTSEDLVL